MLSSDLLMLISALLVLISALLMLISALLVLVSSLLVRISPGWCLHSHHHRKKICSDSHATIFNNSNGKLKESSVRGRLGASQPATARSLKKHPQMIQLTNDKKSFHGNLSKEMIAESPTCTCTGAPVGSGCPGFTTAMLLVTKYYAKTVLCTS